MVFALVFVRGAVNAIDNPTRQSFVIEMVGADRVVNAVGLNSVLIHAARIVGPAGAGVLIATLGVAPCFLLNAATFAAMIVALRGMDPARLTEPRATRDGERGGVRAALRYLRGEPALLIPLAMMAVVGTLAFNFQVLLPLLAPVHLRRRRRRLHGARRRDGGRLGRRRARHRRARAGQRAPDRRLGGRLRRLRAAGRGRAEPRGSRCVALVPLGAVSVTFAAGVNSTLQLGASPAMRGRVMALYSVVFLGSTPIGGPIVGWLAEVAGPRSGLVLARRRGDRRRRRRLDRLRAPSRPAFSPVRASARARCDALRGLGRRGWRRLAGGAVAVEAGRADQLDGLEGRRRLDVEADPVALLDRGDGAPRVRARRARSGSRSRRRSRRPGARTSRRARPASAKAPIGHSRMNAIRPGLSAGRLVAVRAPASSRAIASAALRRAPEPDADRGRRRPTSRPRPRARTRWRPGWRRRR